MLLCGGSVRPESLANHSLFAGIRLCIAKKRANLAGNLGGEGHEFKSCLLHTTVSGFPEFAETIFPNCLLYVAERTYLTHIFWPLAEDRTIWEVTFYYTKAKTLARRFCQEYAKVILRDINMEDGSTVERTQLMLASGAKKEIVLQDQELLIRHHHKVAETFLNG